MRRSMNREDMEDNELANFASSLENPSKYRMIVYYSMIVIGYAALINEAAMAKFIYESGNEAIKEISKTVLKIPDPSDVTINIIMGIIASISLLNSFSAISPLTDAKKILNLQLINNKIYFDPQSTTINYSDNRFKNARTFFLYRLAPCGSSIITFIVGCLPTWVVIKTALT